VVPTAGEVFMDGIIDSIVSLETRTPVLFHSHDGIVTTGTRISIGNRVYVSLEADPSILTAMWLPQKIVVHGFAAQFVGDISKLISRLSRLDDLCSMLASFFVRSSWLLDSLPSTPQIRVAERTKRRAPEERL
jgi:hypothetical protein